ncbi:MAG: hypothetical protein NTY42_17045 [Planctomycetota bacterium]|nr:hypothetical protein [Planctomycetota bacterium]
MGEWNVNGRDGTKVDDARQMMGMFLGEVFEKAKRLQEILDDDPLLFEQVEQETKELFDYGAGLFLTGLIAKTMKTVKHQQRSDEVREKYIIPLRSGQDRQIEVHMASGFSCHAKTRYCQPKKSNQEDFTPGLDIELSLFGFSGSISPWLVSKVTRTVALSTSLDQAHKELHRDGIKLDRNMVDRIVTQSGSEMLTVRERMLDEFESGAMAPGNEFEGQTVSIQIDGGRTRTRSELTAIDPLENFGKTLSEVHGLPSEGRSKEQRRKGTFTASWREPKVLKIYVHGTDGRKNEEYLELIDGSFGDADYMERLIAMHIWRLGMHKAKSITFNSDGATWIWDRIESILERAKVTQDVLIFNILDVYHAAENINKGINALGQEPGDNKQFQELRTKLRDGNWKEVSDTLRKALDLSQDNPRLDRDEVVRVINYIRQHGEAGHLDYPKFSLMGLPMGSGAIESAIRRVVNLRMKNNGTFWRVSKAECILVLRSSILSGRWDEDRKRTKLAMQRNRKLSMPPVRESAPSKSDARNNLSKSQ